MKTTTIAIKNNARATPRASRRRAARAARTASTLVLSAALAALAACTTAGPDGKREAPVIGGSEAVRTLAPPELPLKPNPDYANFPLYSGTLGKRPIEMRLGSKTDDPTGVHGEYRFLDGRTGVMLVAGDLDNGTLEIEESDDGVHITGNWVGKVAADGSISGERMNPDDSNPQPFDLQPANAAARGAHAPVKGTAVSPGGTPSPAGRAASASAAASSATASMPSPDVRAATSTSAPAVPPAATAMPAPTPSHGVGGVSNVTTGD